MAKQKKRRKGFPLRLVLILAILMVVTFLFIADPLFNLDFGLLRTDETAVSIALLTEVREIFALNTIEFIHKSVFPHDFIPEDADWSRLLVKRREGILLSEEELSYLEFYDLCKELGLSADPDSYDFVVVTSIVKGGFNLAGTIYENPTANPEEAASAVRVREDTVELLLPEPEITDFIIEDASSESYAYPDLDIDPGEWRLLTSYLQSRVEGMVKDEGILDMAKERGRNFIEGMLKDAGFREVVFLSP